MKRLVNFYHNENPLNDFQEEQLAEIFETALPSEYPLFSEYVPIDPTVSHTLAGQVLLTFASGTNNKAITSAMPGFLKGDSHNSLSTKTSHHPSTSVYNTYVAPNLSVKQQSPSKSGNGKTLSAIIKIVKQLKAFNQDEQSLSLNIA